MDLLFGSIARSSPHRPELALAPVARPAPAVGEVEQPGSPAEEGAQEGREPEPEIDALAQKVYGALKLRLAVERERLGGMS